MNETPTPSTNPLESNPGSDDVNVGGASSVAPAAPAPASGPKRQGPRYWKWYLASFVLLAAVIAGGIAATANNSSTPTAANGSTTTAVKAINSASSQSNTAGTLAPSQRLDARAVGEKVVPSVVTVQISGTTMSGQETEVGSGSGVIYDTQGHILTNNHVAEAGSSYEVVLSDGRIYPAEVVGTDPTTDLAVLKVTAENLQPIGIGSTKNLTVGDPAVAVGSPLGLQGGPSLTVGVLSAFGRTVQTDSSTTLFGMLQTDAPITQGSSGGALVDENGNLIGITTAIGVSSVGVEGIGFATPVEIVTRVADEIIATGSASSPYLGVEISPAMQDTADGGSAPVGLKLQTVVAGSAADTAGLQVGDIVTAINGTPVNTNSDLIGELRRYSSGAEIQLTLNDGRTVNVTLGERPANL
jgi:S1-C subfamily serine protease